MTAHPTPLLALETPDDCESVGSSAIGRERTDERDEEFVSFVRQLETDLVRTTRRLAPSGVDPMDLAAEALARAYAQWKRTSRGASRRSAACLGPRLKESSMTDRDPRFPAPASGQLAEAALRRGKRLRRRRQLTRWGVTGSLALVLTAGLTVGIMHASSGPSVAPTGGGTTTSSSATPSTAPATSSTSTTSATTTMPAPAGGVVPADFQATSFTAVSLDEWWMLGTARCIVGSGTCGAIVRTTDGGSTFTGIPSPPVSAGDVTQLRFATALDGYAFGPQLWETTDGGARWSQVPTPGTVTELEAADGEAYALSCAAGSNCQSMALLRSPVGATQWQSVSTPVTLGYGAQFALSGPNLYLLSGNEPPLVLLYTDNDAATFSKRLDPGTPSLGGRLTAAADGSPTLWAASPTGTMAATELSTDGGTTWRVVAATGEFPNSVGLAAASSSVALVWPGPEISGQAPTALD
ncbi:MAG: hypothetical protein WAL04_06780, partial [Acidimicrobiales bacterium]